MSARHEVVVVGGGHNGLVAAGYLARAGVDVLVCEGRPVVGGACVTEELWPGFRFSTAAVVIHLMRPQIIRELELRRYGLVTERAHVDRAALWEDGRTLILQGHLDEQLRTLRRHCPGDASGLMQFGARLRRFAALYEPTVLAPPPSYDAFRELVCGVDPLLFEEFVTGSIGDVIDRYFSSPEMRATLAFLGMVSVDAAPNTPGTGYVYGHHAVGGLDGDLGAHGYVRGGMGGLTQALAASARVAGAKILVDAEVRRILVDDGAARGVELTDGRVFGAGSVVSGLDPARTMLRLVGSEHLEPEFELALTGYDFGGSMARMHLALAELPRYTAAPHTGSSPTAAHLGVTLLGAEMGRFAEAHAAQRRGELVGDPVLEVTIPSAHDPTLAPPGRHTLTLGVMHTPYALADGTWDDRREEFGDLLVDRLCEFAPNVRSAIIAREVMSPLDLERTFGLTGGNIFQGAMTPAQILSGRPLPGWSAYRMPVENLYLCGSGTHPGGAVSGAPGHNAAQQVLRDRLDPPGGRAGWVERAGEQTALRPASRQGALLDGLTRSRCGRSALGVLARQPMLRPLVRRAGKTPR